MLENFIENPFIACTARDMNYDEVKEYWCSPFELYGLNEKELFVSKTPIVIEGIRGSGKTMILKYLSYNVQSGHFSGDYKSQLEFFRENSFGIYYRYKEDVCELFATLDCSDADKESFFRYYFELHITRELLNDLKQMCVEEVPDFLYEAFSASLNARIESFDDAIMIVTSRIMKMEDILNTSSYDDEWIANMQQVLGNPYLINDVVAAISAKVKDFSDVIFVVLLDEYENLGAFKPVINTLIKKVDNTCNITYRIGTRPAGIEIDNRTHVGKEKIQVDRDFILRRLVFREVSQYKKFAIEIAEKRLQRSSEYSSAGLCNIKDLLGAAEDFDDEAKKVARTDKQFVLLRDVVPSGKMDDVIKAIACDDKLLEMYNILLVSRGSDYIEVAHNCREYQKRRSAGKNNITKEDGSLYKYNLDYVNKYRLTLLYMLLTIYKEKKQYYSFNTFIYLSSGSINDFISLCRNTFKLINKKMLKELSNGETIDKQIQTYGARDTAVDQMIKLSQSNSHGNQMRCFVDNMGCIFEEYHRDLKARYPETNQFAFVDENRIRTDDRLNSFLMELINSGAIIVKPHRQLKSVGLPRGNVYQLNRIFAPTYQYSYRTRGGYNHVISSEEFEEMLTNEVPHGISSTKTSTNHQMSLF